MIAMLMRKVRIVAAGMRRPPNFLSGAATAATRCWSHFEAVTAAAKPMAEQMAGTSVGFVIPFTKDWKALSGSPATAHMQKPATTSSMRVSSRLTRPTIVRTIAATANQICQVMMGSP